MRLRKAPIDNRASPQQYTWVNKFGEFQIYKRVGGTQVRIAIADTQSHAEEIVDALNLIAEDLARTA